MSKGMTKTVVNPVGATSSRPHFEEKTQKGITLIALIITIIVMLILVGVTVTVALNGGLFSSAENARANTQLEKQKEQTLASGQVEVDGKLYGTLQDYVDNNPVEYETEIEGLPTIVTVVPYENLSTEMKTAVNKGKISTVLQETITLNGKEIEAKAVVPTGFEISTVEGENTISGGLVIKDGDNEFVWVPVENYSSYTEDGFGPSGYVSEDTTIDSYQYVQSTHKDSLGVIDSDDKFNEVFSYTTDKTNVEQNIQKYGGFYVGRYKTTYDSLDENNVAQGIGVKQSGEDLKATSILQVEADGQAIQYRWFGLYKIQKDIYAENDYVGSLMISLKQWNSIMSFTEQYSNIKNIQGLNDTNLGEWTITSNETLTSYSNRYCYGGMMGGSSMVYDSFTESFAGKTFGSRITLYIK